MSLENAFGFVIYLLSCIFSQDKLKPSKFKAVLTRALRSDVIAASFYVLKRSSSLVRRHRDSDLLHLTASSAQKRPKMKM